MGAHPTVPSSKSLNTEICFVESIEVTLVLASTHRCSGSVAIWGAQVAPLGKFP